MEAPKKPPIDVHNSYEDGYSPIDAFPPVVLPDSAGSCRQYNGQSGGEGDFNG